MGGLSSGMMSRQGLHFAWQRSDVLAVGEHHQFVFGGRINLGDGRTFAIFKPDIQ